MIERYLPKKMKTLFSDEERFQAYLDVEIAVDEAWCEIGVIPQEDIVKIKANVIVTASVNSTSLTYAIAANGISSKNNNSWSL